LVSLTVSRNGTIVNGFRNDATLEVTVGNDPVPIGHSRNLSTARRMFFLLG